MEDESSSESDGPVTSYGDWPEWKFKICGKEFSVKDICQRLFDYGDHAHPLRSIFLAHQYTCWFFWAEKITTKHWDREKAEQDQTRHFFDGGQLGYTMMRIISVLNLAMVVFDIV
jgi:hypothetical protein